jgi:hypothetical protein
MDFHPELDVRLGVDGDVVIGGVISVAKKHLVIGCPGLH